MYTSLKRLLLTKTGEIVEATDPRGVSLLVAEGGTMTDDEAVRYGLMTPPKPAEIGVPSWGSAAGEVVALVIGDGGEPEISLLVSTGHGGTVRIVGAFLRFEDAEAAAQDGDVAFSVPVGYTLPGNGHSACEIAVRGLGDTAALQAQLDQTAADLSAVRAEVDTLRDELGKAQSESLALQAELDASRATDPGKPDHPSTDKPAAASDPPASAVDLNADAAAPTAPPAKKAAPAADAASAAEQAVNADAPSAAKGS